MDTSLISPDGRGSWRAAIGFTAVVLLGFGFLYSLAGAGIGRVLFPQPAQGSLLERDGRVVGSALVAQPFAADAYFSSRPSAAGNAGYDPMSASGSNQARSNPDLRRRIGQAIAGVAAREGIAPAQVPDDLVTQSGSGLDPHLSPAAAQVQAARVAKARGLDPARVRQLIAANTERPQFGFLGQPRVNVLALNLALDALH